MCVCVCVWIQETKDYAPLTMSKWVKNYGHQLQAVAQISCFLPPSLTQVMDPLLDCVYVFVCLCSFVCAWWWGRGLLHHWPVLHVQQLIDTYSKMTTFKFLALTTTQNDFDLCEFIIKRWSICTDTNCPKDNPNVSTPSFYLSYRINSLDT